MLHWQLGLVSALLLALSVGAVLAFLVGLLCIRRKSIYFVMLTLALTQMAYFLAYTLSNWTGGDNGLLGRQQLGYHGLPTLLGVTRNECLLSPLGRFIGTGIRGHDTYPDTEGRAETSRRAMSKTYRSGT